jgi:3-hydroxybutyryl-CoA dehydratase
MSTQEYRARALFFEELHVGDTMISPGRTVTETDLVNFCGLSGDYNELHSNVEYAGQSSFGQRIAHGLLGMTIASGLAARLGFMEGAVEAFMGIEWKFKQPIFIGDTVHLLVRVAKLRAMPRLNGGLAFFDMELMNQKDEVVQTGQWVLLMKSETGGSSIDQ